ncbi:unnamed protein product [Calicophoron daubneyi]|uniref:Succinate-semialdehyde dehydrogenase, mitochondrial n=1 Tax=Calicophoron daubneyi TaxID=300641 RepID=A0AAV2TXH7_CALDB
MSFRFANFLNHSRKAHHTPHSRLVQTPEPLWYRLVPEEKTFVAGNWVTSASGRTFPVTNPANGHVLRTVPAMSSAAAEQAINAASTAQKIWATRPPNERASVIRRWAQSLRSNQEALARLITAENGKTISDARTEVSSGASGLEWYAEEVRRNYGYFVPPLQKSGRRQIVHHQPVGVIGVITPWNFPLSMITRKAGAALAAGCAVVLKPAEDTPLTALAITHLAVTEAGLPPELLSTITAARDVEGAQQIAETFCNHPDVRMIGFTGSTVVGKMIYKKAAAHAKRVLLEMGGNAPLLVFRSANLEKAVEGAIAAKFRCSGQTCVCVNRIYVENDIYESFVQKLAEGVSKLKMGDGSIEDTKIGPLVNRKAVDKVEGLVNSAKKDGAIALVGGERPKDEEFAHGSFYPATVLSECHSEMACVRNEIFGPVAPVCRFSKEDEAFKLANQTPYGLAAYVYTQDIRQIWRASVELQYGMVGINTPWVSTPEMPFGGVKDSGIGREGGPHALEEFMDTKTICWDID